jgi:hypothetical protein
MVASKKRVPWQHKPVGNPSYRDLKKTDKTKVLVRKAGATRMRDGRWYSHGLEDYKLWWEFLVRAEQNSKAPVVWDEYEGWGEPSDFQQIDVWSSKSRKEGFWEFWKSYGMDLFAENEDELVKVHSAGKSVKVPQGKICLEIPTTTTVKMLGKIVEETILQHSTADKSSHLSTAAYKIETKNEDGKTIRRDIKRDAFRRWLKIWDMSEDGSTLDEIKDIHGGDERILYRDKWKALNIIANVASGEFPGSTEERKKWNNGKWV